MHPTEASITESLLNNIKELERGTREPAVAEAITRSAEQLIRKEMAKIAIAKVNGRFANDLFEDGPAKEIEAPKPKKGLPKGA